MRVLDLHRKSHINRYLVLAFGRFVKNFQHADLAICHFY
jgi:hypothetical protein